MARAIIPGIFGLFLAMSVAKGADLQINNHASQDQKDVDLAVNELGQAVAVWNSYLQDGSSGGIYCRRIDPNGAIGSEIRVNTLTAGNQAEPAVAMDGAGRFLVVWRGPWPESDDMDILARLMDANGIPLSEEVRVNTTVLGKQVLPRVTCDGQGRFLVVWESDGLADPTKKWIVGRIIGADGQPAGQEIAASDTPTYACRYADIGADLSGRFVVSWLEDRTTRAVRLRLFGPDGTPRTDSIKANTIGIKSLTWPSMAMTWAGDIILAWDGDPDLAANDDIHCRRFDPNGQPMADQFLVNSAQTGAQRNPRVGTNERGDFAVVWDGEDPQTGLDVYYQRFDGQGLRVGVEARLNTHLPANQQEPDVVLTDKGVLMAAWESQDQDGSGTGVFGLVGPMPASADLNQDGLIDFGDFGLLAGAWSSQDPLATGNIINDNSVDALDLSAFCCQWLKAQEALTVDPNKGLFGGSLF